MVKLLLICELFTKVHELISIGQKARDNDSNNTDWQIIIFYKITNMHN